MQAMQAFIKVEVNPLHRFGSPVKLMLFFKQIPAPNPTYIWSITKAA